MTTYDLLCLTPSTFMAHSPRHGIDARGAFIPMWLARRARPTTPMPVLIDLVPEEEDQLVIDDHLGVVFASVAVRRGVGPLPDRHRAIRLTSLGEPLTLAQKTALFEADVRYIGDCAARTEEEVLAIPWMDRSSVDYLRDVMAEVGLSFKGG